MPKIHENPTRLKLTAPRTLQGVQGIETHPWHPILITGFTWIYQPCDPGLVQFAKRKKRNHRSSNLGEISLDLGNENQGTPWNNYIALVQ